MRKSVQGVQGVQALVQALVLQKIIKKQQLTEFVQGVQALCARVRVNKNIFKQYYCIKKISRAYRIYPAHPAHPAQALIYKGFFCAGTLLMPAHPAQILIKYLNEVNFE